MYQYLSFKVVLDGGGGACAVDEDEAQGATGVCQSEPGKYIGASTLPQSDHVLDLHEVEDGDQLLAQGLQGGELVPGTARSYLHHVTTSGGL